MIKLMIFDLNDTLIHSTHDDGWFFSRNQCLISPGATELLGHLHVKGCKLAIATNQTAHHKFGGLIQSDMKALMRWTRSLLANRARMDERFLPVFACYHDRDEGCDCRKPKTGLITMAMEHHDIPPEQTYVVGDWWSDIAAGRAAGCRTIGVGNWGYQERNGTPAPDDLEPPDVFYSDLDALDEAVSGGILGWDAVNPFELIWRCHDLRSCK